MTLLKFHHFIFPFCLPFNSSKGHIVYSPSAFKRIDETSAQTLSPELTMNQYNQQNQFPAANSAPPTSYPPPEANGYTNQYVMAPPPIGYPSKDGNEQGNAPVQTQSRGDGCLKGILAGLCCCCCLDVCF